MVSETRIRTRSKWRLILAFIVTASFSLLPDLHLERSFGMDYTWWFDMIQHGGYYFVLTLILFYILPNEKRSPAFFFSIFSISVAFEFIQILIPGRTFSPLDICSNFLGIACGFLVKNAAKILKEDYDKLKKAERGY